MPYRQIPSAAIDMDRSSIGDIGTRLPEPRQDHGPARALQSVDEIPVRYRIGGGTEVHVEYDVARTCGLELAEQIGMRATRPWPNADGRDRSGINRDDDDVATRLARFPTEPEIRQRVSQRPIPSRTISAARPI